MMLQVRGLNVAYGDLPALWDVAFDVRAGELVAMIGPNGAGKTTALKAILGLVRCQAGDITFQERPIQQPAATPPGASGSGAGARGPPRFSLL